MAKGIIIGLPLSLVIWAGLVYAALGFVLVEDTHKAEMLRPVFACEDPRKRLIIQRGTLDEIAAGVLEAIEGEKCALFRKGATVILEDGAGPVRRGRLEFKYQYFFVPAEALTNWRPYDVGVVPSKLCHYASGRCLP